THPTKGSYFTRGTTKDRYARYTEEGPAYVDNMQRLLRKFETAKSMVPMPIVTKATKPTKSGVVYFGSTSAAIAESLAALELDGDHPGVLRARRGAASRGQALRHRVLVEDADVFPRQLARLQQRAWPDALGAHGRRACQQEPDLPRRVGRRRFRVHRPRAVR